MIYAIIENEKIIALRASNEVPKGVTVLPDDFCGTVGMNVAEFNPDWSVKTLEERKEYITIPKGYKVVGDQFVEMTQAEKYREGVEDIPVGMKLVGDELVAMTDEEKVVASLMTQEDLDTKVKEKERQDILSRLEELDRKSIRSLRAKEDDRLASLEAEAVELRNRLKEVLR